MMRKNRSLKAQDLVILGKLITDPKWPVQKDISDSLMVSQSEVSHALKTLEHVGLIDLKAKKVNKLHVIEFITHALKFFFPIEKKGTGRGLLIGPSFSAFKTKVQSDEYNYIWPDSDGSAKGIIVVPLMPDLSKAVRENPELFAYLNIIEIFRGLGGVRHLQEAQKMLRDLLNESKHRTP